MTKCDALANSRSKHPGSISTKFLQEKCTKEIPSLISKNTDGVIDPKGRHRSLTSEAQNVLFVSRCGNTKNSNFISFVDLIMRTTNIRIFNQPQGLNLAPPSASREKLQLWSWFLVTISKVTLNFNLTSISYLCVTIDLDLPALPHVRPITL